VPKEGFIRFSFNVVALNSRASFRKEEALSMCALPFRETFLALFLSLFFSIDRCFYPFSIKKVAAVAAAGQWDWSMTVRRRT